MSKPNYHDYIREVADFPKSGINFYDIAPLLGQGAVFSSLIKDMSEPLRNEVTQVVSFDARGFLFGAAMAAELGVGCVMLRKAGKLPGDTHRIDYDLEYGSNALEIQADVLNQHDRAVLVDDVIATGGTALAGIELVRRSGASIVEFCALLDLPELGGSATINEAGVTVRAIVSK